MQVRKLSRLCHLALAGLVWHAASSDMVSHAGERDRIRFQQPNDLFYNYYVDGAGAVPAGMYPAPLPAPPHVGYTYYTYPPFYPHELMYHHKRAWYTYHPGAGWTRTKAYYSSHGGLWGRLSNMRRYGWGTLPAGVEGYGTIPAHMP